MEKELYNKIRINKNENNEKNIYEVKLERTKGPYNSYPFIKGTPLENSLPQNDNNSFSNQNSLSMNKIQSELLKTNTNLMKNIKFDKEIKDILKEKEKFNKVPFKFPILRPNRSQSHLVSINSKLINDLNSQIKEIGKSLNAKKISYKQTVNLQRLNDYIVYESTRNKIEKSHLKNQKNSMDFRIPLIYRRIANHYKKEDLIPIKNKPKINLEDILIMHNSTLRKYVSKNRVKNYYFKNNLRLTHKNFRIVNGQIDSSHEINEKLL